MNEQQRFLERFATVQLTLLSIVVALVLENLLSQLLEMGQWSPLVMLQATDILMSSLSMWVGFAYGLSRGATRPTPIDFIGLFALLIFMQLAVRCIATGFVAGFFLAGAGATGSAALMLYKDVRAAKRAGVPGPNGMVYLLLGITLLEVVGALGVYAGWFGQPVAMALIALTALGQATGAWRSMRFWYHSFEDPS